LNHAEHWVRKLVKQLTGQSRPVGFAGAGASWNEKWQSCTSQNVTTGGFGMGYEIARKYGPDMDLDVAYGPNGSAWYVQFGSV
jgi:hypothetical protein